MTIIPTTEGAEQSISNAIVPASKTAGSSAGVAMGAAMGAKLGGAGAALTAGLTVPLAGVAKGAIDVGMTFADSMASVQALSGATGDELALLEQTARDFGSSTKYSASEAADALGYMALAGWDTSQMVDGLGGVLNLAAASGMDLASASDMVTDYLSAFGMEAKDSAYFADMLAYAQANSNTSAMQLGEAYRNSAANLHAAGQDVETVTSLLAMMANQGLKGSEAGTALTAMMRDLSSKMEDGAIYIGDTAVAVVDANGNFRDMTDILRDVEAATQGMGDAERTTALQSTFTADSIRGVNLVLAAGVESAASFETGLRSSTGAASEMAEIMGDTLSGRMTELKGKIDEVGLKLFDTMEPALTTVIDAVSNAVDGFTEFWNAIGPGGQTAIIVLLGVAAAAGPVLVAVGGFVTILPMVTAGITAFKTGFAALNVVMRANPILAVVGVIATLVAMFLTAYNTNEDFRKKVDEVFGKIKDTIGGFFDFFGGIVEGIKGFIDDVGGFFGGLGDTIGRVFGWVQDDVDTTMDEVETKTEETTASIAETTGISWESLKASTSEAWEGIQSTIATDMETANFAATSAGSAIEAALRGDWDAAGLAASEGFEAVKTNIGDKLEGAKQFAIGAGNQIGEIMGFPGMGDTVAAVFGDAKEIIGDMLGRAKDLVGSGIDAMVNFFANAHFELPHINLPHFSIQGSFSLNPLSVPYLAIDWYASGGVFDRASIIGVGESGPEAVVPLAGQQMQPFADAVAERLGGAGVTVHIDHMQVREESDIERVAERLATIVDRRRRALA